MKRWGIFAAAILALLVLTAAALPALLSSGPGKGFLEAYLNRKINGEVSIGSLQLRWFGPQKVEKLFLQQRELTATLDLFEANQGLLSLLVYGPQLQNGRLVNFNASLPVEGRQLELIQAKGELSLPKGELSGKTRDGALEGDFFIKAVFAAKSRIEVEFRKFPTPFLDVAVAANNPELNGIAEAIFGNYIDLKIEELREEGELNAGWRVNSPNFNATLKLEADPASFWISEPASVEFTLQPQAVSIFTAGKEGGPLELKRPAKGLLRIKQLEIPLFHPLSHFSSVADFELNEAVFSNPELSFSRIRGSLFVPKTADALQLNLEAEGSGFRLKAEGETERPEKGQGLLDKLIQKTKLQIDAKGFPTALFGSRYPALFGPRLSGSVEVNIEKREGSASVALSSEILELQEAEFKIGRNITLKKPFSLHYTLSPTLLAQMERPLKTVFRLNHLSFPRPVRRYDGSLSPPNFDKVQLDLDLRAEEEALFSLPENMGGLAVENAVVTLAGTTLYDLRYSVKGALLPSDPKLLSWTGEKLQTEGTGRLTLSSRTVQLPDIHIEAKSDTLSGSLRGRYMEGILHLTSPARLVWKVTPELFRSFGLPAALKADSDWEMTVMPTALPLNREDLLENLNFEGQLRNEALLLALNGRLLSIKQFLVPWKVNGSEKSLSLSAGGKTFYEEEVGEGSFNARASFKKWNEIVGGKASLINFPAAIFDLATGEPEWSLFLGKSINAELESHFSDEGELKRLDLALHGSALTVEGTVSAEEKLAFDLEAHPTASSGNRGTLQLKGELENGFTREGKLNTEELSCSLTAKAEAFQTRLFCALFCPYPTLPHKIEALLGDPINADLSVKLAKMQGPLKAELAGSNGTLQLKGKIGSGALTLDEPLLAQVRATPELGRYVLKDVAPFLSGLESAEKPLRIAFSEQGFSFPVHDFSVERIAIPGAAIDMGKMRFANRAQIGAILSLLGAAGSGATVDVWVTPLYFSMQKGVVKLERVDMFLENRFPVAAWGVADLLNNRVNMVIGIRGFALLNAFQIKGVTRDTMIQMSLKGPIDNPKIDKAQIAARISSLIAQTQGERGELIGSLIDIASGLTKSKAPPPTTDPLPWEEEMPEPQEAAPSKKPRSSREKELEKAGKSLIKNLFGK